MTRRQLLAATLATPALWGKRHFDRSRLSAITDEIGKTPDESIAFAKQYGLQWVELRSVPGGKEYIYQDEATLKATAASLRSNGLKVSFLNSSLMKFPWPGIEPARRRQESAEAAAKRKAADGVRYEKRMEDLKKALHAAQILGVDKLRIFTGSRAVEPRQHFARIADIIGEMGFAAEKEKVHLLVENEGSCNVGTSQESAEFIKLIPSKWVGLNWDPQNTLGLKEVPFPDGYNTLPKKRILNVQYKGKGIMPESKDRLDWKAILLALDKDGYKGCVGQETHIFDGTLIQAAHVSMKEMLRIVGEL
jgi:sugar phosphate isomerase/epimerase